MTGVELVAHEAVIRTQTRPIKRGPEVKQAAAKGGQRHIAGVVGDDRAQARNAGILALAGRHARIGVKHIGAVVIHVLRWYIKLRNVGEAVLSAEEQLGRNLFLQALIDNQ